MPEETDFRPLSLDPGQFDPDVVEQGRAEIEQLLDIGDAEERTRRSRLIEGSKQEAMMAAVATIMGSEDHQEIADVMLSKPEVKKMMQGFALSIANDFKQRIVQSNPDLTTEELKYLIGINAAGLRSRFEDSSRELGLSAAAITAIEAEVGGEIVEKLREEMSSN